MTVLTNLPTEPGAGEVARLRDVTPRHRRAHRPLRYWLSPSYTSKRARIEVLERLAEVQAHEIGSLWLTANQTIICLGEHAGVLPVAVAEPAPQAARPLELLQGGAR